MSRGIGKIENYYGGLEIKEEDGKFYWSIRCYTGHCWEEMPESLYDELNKFENKRRGGCD